ncbi:MAG TPA: DUF523 and DUF1722 domain-containing protein [bacterium]
MPLAPRRQPPPIQWALPERLRIGISSCLLGENVRWDGNTKRNDYILGSLTQYFEFVPVCPEMAIGLGVPREPIRLVGSPTAPRVLGVETPSLDVTDALAGYGRRMARQLTDISGYILKARSPSCGMEHVLVHRGRGRPVKQGTGMYAAAFMAQRPELPVAEEGHLEDAQLCENFIARVFTLARWQSLAASGMTPGKLVAFHTAHKLMLMAHGDAPYRALGRMVAQAGTRPIGALSREYLVALMTALRTKAPRKVHANVMDHLAGYLKTTLAREDKAKLRDVIRAYRIGEVPFSVPITLFRHHFQRHPHPYVAGQVYLDPHPAELALRSEM